MFQLISFIKFNIIELPTIEVYLLLPCQTSHFDPLGSSSVNRTFILVHGWFVEKAEIYGNSVTDRFSRSHSIVLTDFVHKVGIEQYCVYVFRSGDRMHANDRLDNYRCIRSICVQIIAPIFSKVMWIYP